MAQGDGLPSQDFVYRWCHQNHWDIENAEPQDAAFRFDAADDAISVYWAAMISALKAHALCTKHHESGVLSLSVQGIRQGNLMDAIHTPNSQGALHPSHSSITKKTLWNKLAARSLLRKIAAVAVPVPPPVENGSDAVTS